MRLIKHASWLLVLPLIILSCQEDNNTQPAEDLTISFDNINPGEVISDSVTVSIDASPREAINQLILSFAGERTDSLDSAPFQFEIDTRTVADGNYTLKATANAEGGQTLTEEISVEVSNPLAVIKIPTSGGDPGYKGYYYGIHTRDGNLIKGGAITLGQEIPVKATQPYPSDTLMVSLYYQTNQEVFIRTFTDAPRGSSWKMNFDQQQPEPADSVHLYITAESFYGFTSSTSLSSNFTYKGNNFYTFPALEGTNQYYVTEYFPVKDRNYEYGTIQDGDTLEIGFLPESATTRRVTAPTDININVSSAYAYNNNPREALLVERYQGTSKDMEFDLPVDEFSNFLIIGNYLPSNGPSNLDGIKTLKHENNVPSAFAYTPGTAVPQTTGSNLSGTAEPEDAQAVVYETNDTPNQTSFYWTVTSSGDLAQTTLEAPEVLKQKFPSLQNVVWESERAFVVKSDAISSYQDFLNIQRSSIYGYAYLGYFPIPNNIYEEKKIVLNPLISNGSQLVVKEFNNN
jgi:hypothetical protein